MLKKTKIIVSVIVGAALLGSVAAFGPVLYRDFIATPAAEAPQIEAQQSQNQSGEQNQAETPGATGPIPVADIQGSWQVGEGSLAGYRVNEVLNGTDVTVTGRTDQVTGTLSFNDTFLESAEFTVDVHSISTDSGQRDSFFRGQALRTHEFPTASSVLAEPVNVESGLTSGEISSHEVSGELTLAGVTRTVSFTVEALAQADSFEVAGQIPIVFADFNVQAPNLGFVKVEDNGFVEFLLRANR